MKHILKALFLSFLFLSCQSKEERLFSPADSYVRFKQATVLAAENRGVVKIVVEASGIANTDLTVNFDFKALASELALPTAKEGVDFEVLNTDKLLRFKNGLGYDTIFLRMIDDQIQNKDRGICIVLDNPSLAYNLGFEYAYASTNLIISDDEMQSKYAGEWLVTSASAFYNLNNFDATGDTAINTTYQIDPYKVIITTSTDEANTLNVFNFMGSNALSVQLKVHEDSKQMFMPYGKIGAFTTGNKEDIFVYGFDKETNTTGTDPIIGVIVDDNHMNFYRFFAGVDGQPIGPITTVLKSKWVRQ